jgi:hypothetical protein
MLLKKWIAFGTLTFGLLTGSSLAQACSADKRAAWEPELSGPRAAPRSASVEVRQLGSPSLQRSLGTVARGGANGGRRLTLLGGGRSPASLGASSPELLQVTLAGSALESSLALPRNAPVSHSNVRLGINPTSYRLKSFQQEMPFVVD